MGTNFSRRSLYLEFFTTPTISNIDFQARAAWPRGEFAVRQGSTPFPNRRANSWLTTATFGEFGVSCSSKSRPAKIGVPRF